MNGHIMVLIAKNEFNRIVRYHIFIVIGLIVAALAFLNGAGNSINLRYLDVYDRTFGNIDAFMMGLSGTWTSTTWICCILASLLGIASVAEDKGKNRLSVLLAKPALKSDIIAGKFFGVAGSMLLFIIFILLLTSLMLILYFRHPWSYIELAWRLIAYIGSLTLLCSMVAGLSMLLGVVFNNYLAAIAFSITYLYAEWSWHLGEYLGRDLSLIMPRYLFSKICDPSPAVLIDIFDTKVHFDSWLINASPYILLMLLEIVIILLISGFILSRQD